MRAIKGDGFRTWTEDELAQSHLKTITTRPKQQLGEVNVNSARSAHRAVIELRQTENWLEVVGAS
jgi:hypothetical protein